MSKLFEEKQHQSKTNEIDITLKKVKAAFQGYKTRKFFYLFKDIIPVNDLDIFTNFTLFKSVFDLLINPKILNYIEKSGMFFKSSDLANKFWICAHFDNTHSFYYGELDKNGDPSQFGIAISNNLVYEGSWNQGIFHGKGRFIDDENGVYDGDWVSGKKHGNGNMLYWNGNKYSGNWVFDMKSGFGVYDEGEHHYEGNFWNDLRDGYGEEKYLDKAFYQGNYVDGLFGGKGKFINPTINYEGDFKDGFFHGKGELKTPFWKYSGDFANGKRSGFGVDENSGEVFENWWENGIPIGECICHTSQGILQTGKWRRSLFIEYIDEILPNLFLGSAEAASNEPLLKQLKIKYIVRILDNENVKLLSGFIYYYLKAKDDKNENIINRVDEALQFIKKRLEKNKKVLVHCYKGVSRSPTVVIAYMMKTQGMAYQDALKFVRSKRWCIKPNTGFKEQLKKIII